MKPSAHFLFDASGKKIAVQLPVQQYNKMLDQLEELEAVKAFDKAMNRKKSFESFDKAMAEIREGKS